MWYRCGGVRLHRKGVNSFFCYTRSGRGNRVPTAYFLLHTAYLLGYFFIRMDRVGLIERRYDFSTAVGFFKNFIGVFLLLSANMIIKRFSEYGIW